MRTQIALLALAGSLAAGPASATDPDLWQRSIPLSGRPSLKVITDDGRVRVGVWDRKEVGLRVETRGWRLNDREVRVAESHSGNDILLEVKQPRFRVDWGFVSRRWITIDLWVPRGVDLDINTGDGDVIVPGVEGRIDIHTGDGDIAVDDAHGELRLRTGDGRITGERLDGSLVAHSGDGTVRVEGRFQGLDISTGDGSITAEVLQGSAVRDAWSVTTGDGRVTVVVPPDLKADLAAHTGDGGITVDLPLVLQGRISHHDVRGTLNGGGPAFTLRTGDGSIQLSSR